MWFKSAHVFTLPKNWQVSRESLETQLARGRYAPPTATEGSSQGWVPVREHGDLVYANNGQWLLRLKISKRILPASVINDETKVRAKATEEQQGYPCGKKQVREIKDIVTLELLPKSHLKHEHILAWVDPKNGWFVVDSSSAGKIDAVTSQLTHCFDEPCLKALHLQQSPTAAMCTWLTTGEPPAEFTVDRDCELKSSDEGKSAIAYKRHPLGDEFSEEIKGHLSAGKLPVSLALTWNDKISFVLTEKLEIKRLAFLDLLKEQASTEAEDAEEQFDADFVLMTGELQKLIVEIVSALGGEAEVD